MDGTEVRAIRTMVSLMFALTWRYARPSTNKRSASKQRQAATKSPASSTNNAAQ
jgi:hypothetical protein